jgi:hypothetical protein
MEFIAEQGFPEQVQTFPIPIKWTPFLACSYIEGFCEGENATESEQLHAYAYLIKTGVVWSLQGFYGRNATRLIENGYVSKDGEVLKEF